MDTTGSRIKALRKQTGLTQSELASRFGVDRSTVASWEINRREIDFETLKQLSALFEVRPEYLLCTTDEKSPTAPPPLTKKTKDLDEFLREADIMFKGTPLTDDAKDRLRNILTEIDGMAKEMNRRKKP